MAIMNNPIGSIGLTALFASVAPALKSVDIEGRLDGLLLDMRIHQRYRNESSENAEVIYTFPLAWGARLMGLDVTIGEKKLRGAVVERQRARRSYEKAIDEGDTPVMVEECGDGLFTANLGNIKPGEEIGLDLRYSQLLRFEQGRIRLLVPTVIAPRYGNAHAEGGLQPHESVAVSLAADYPLTLRIDLASGIAAAHISSPSHAIVVHGDDGGSNGRPNVAPNVTLAAGAVLDRDFVLVLDGLAGQSFALVAPDNSDAAGSITHTVLASFCPAIRRDSSVPLALKILVDCSGSMTGDSIRSAKEALHRILAELDDSDYVSFSRFGSQVKHEGRRLEPCNSATIGRLAEAIGKTNANLGGTELKAALLSTFHDIAAPAYSDKRELPSPTILLITDGEIWDVKNVIAEAKHSGHRIFAVGLGSAPAETLHRQLAETTGGACELVAPGEDIAGAIVRMFHRMRGVVATGVRIEWGADAEPLWQSATPYALYDGETVHLFGQFARLPGRAPQLSWKIGDDMYTLRPESLVAVSNEAAANLPRLAGWQKMAEATSVDEKTALAMQYQLVSKYTNLFLVHVRAADGKASGLPILWQVPQMLAAGWGGVGSVHACFAAPSEPHTECRIADASIARPLSKRMSSDASKAWPRERGTGLDEDFELQPFGSKSMETPPMAASHSESTGKTSDEALSAMLVIFIRFSLQSIDLTEIVSKLSGSTFAQGALNAVVAKIAQETGIDTVDIWAVLLGHLLGQNGLAFPLFHHANRLLRQRLKMIPDVKRQQIIDRWQQDLAGLSGKNSNKLEA